MAVLSLVLSAVFGVVAVGLRGWIHYRQTGNSPFLKGAGQSGSAAIFGLAIALIAGPVLELVASTGRLFEGPATTALGVVLTVVGLALTVWSQFAMGTDWRIGVDPAERTNLVSAGPFRWVRNPIYSGMVVFAIGLALLVPNVASFAAALALAAALEFHVRRVEEPYLTDVHGAEYRSYAASVGRFVPGVGKLAT